MLCEKPLANTLAEAEAMQAAARKAFEKHGAITMLGFNYRRIPAVTLAAEMVMQGAVGRIRHVRAVYLQDWLIDPNFPLTWRLQRETAGSGSLGDLASHIIDRAQLITGQQITTVSALTETFVTERPVASSADGLAASASTDERGPVTVDDAVLFLARLTGGAIGTLPPMSQSPTSAWTGCTSMTISGVRSRSAALTWPWTWSCQKGTSTSRLPA